MKAAVFSRTWSPARRVTGDGYGRAIDRSLYRLIVIVVGMRVGVVGELEADWTQMLELAAQIATIVAAIGLLGTARQLGWLDRPRFRITSTFLPPTQLVLGNTVPAFEVIVDNTSGNAPVTLSDFRLGLARRDDPDMVETDPETGQDQYTAINGGTIYVDGRKVSTVQWIQEFKHIDYLTAPFTVPPHARGRRILDFSRMLPELQVDGFGAPATGWDAVEAAIEGVEWPFDGVDAVLIFTATSAKKSRDFHATPTGLREGAFEHPRRQYFKRYGRSSSTIPVRGTLFRKRLSVGVEDRQDEPNPWR